MLLAALVGARRRGRRGRSLLGGGEREPRDHDRRRRRVSTRGEPSAGTRREVASTRA